MDNNERRAVVLPHSLLEALDKYAASKHISKSEAIRKFIEKGCRLQAMSRARPRYEIISAKKSKR